ncbi:hypothetical protein LPJ53_001137 [Coemansia erecta]|uniref:Uncharacterized protein n=1 Tax=Coemansia erecta TaxID=147472 RepID=A0A9W8CUE5_9FUNG|nr:hypothetical protein LPJ53_001137 [Coemansia erecta]
MKLAKEKLKGVALTFVETNHYSDYDQMAKSLLAEFSDNWFQSAVLKIIESGEAFSDYPIDQRRDRLMHLFKLLGSNKEAVSAIANYLYHEDNTAWENVGIKPSQTRAEDYASYTDTYCNAADHIMARQCANEVLSRSPTDEHPIQSQDDMVVCKPSEDSSNEADEETQKQIGDELAKSVAEMFKTKKQPARPQVQANICSKCNGIVYGDAYSYHCNTCEFECGSADLYFDHLYFDSRHIELAQKEAEEETKSKEARRSRSIKRSSILVV